MLQTICQWLIVLHLASSVLLSTYWDCEGRAAKQPTGFKGIVGTIIVFAILVAVFGGAGCFSSLFGKAQ